MRKLDILSSAPQNFIFRNNSNKTNFGGVLSLIYLIIVLIIGAYFLVFYFLKDNYSIEYLYFQDSSMLNEQKWNDKKNDPRYNPTFHFNVSLIENDRIQQNKRFIIKDISLNRTVENSVVHEKKITEVNYRILYDCLNDTTCQIDKNKIKIESLFLQFQYDGYVFDHQNTTSPFYKFGNHFLSIQLEKFNKIEFGWSIVKYSEDKDFFSIFDGLREKDEDDDKIIAPILKGT